MTNTIKKVTFASLAALSLAGFFAVVHPSTVSAETNIGILEQKKNSSDFIKQIKASKESIKKSILDKLENKRPDAQEISKRIHEKNAAAIDDYILKLDIKFIVNTEGLNRIEIPGIKKFLTEGLESAITVAEEKHLEELATYYECFDLYFKIDDMISKAENFEDYIFNNNDAKLSEQLGENRFTHLIDALK